MQKMIFCDHLLIHQATLKSPDDAAPRRAVQNRLTNYFKALAASILFQCRKMIFCDHLLIHQATLKSPDDATPRRAVQHRLTNFVTCQILLHVKE